MNPLRKLLGKKSSGPPPVDIAKRFSREAPLGHGTMSKVWRATDRMTGKTVVLKILDPEVTKKYEERFVGLDKPTEGEIAVSLDHRRIVKTLEHGVTTDGDQFLVMELLEGKILTEMIAAKHPALRRSEAKIARQIGEGIAYLHSQNLILRDCCPRNIMVTTEGVKLIDFGLVVPNTPPFQKPGNRTGTVNYMAPELVKRGRTDQRIDIFSYAVTCYELLACDLPWPRGESIDHLVRTMNDPPTPLRTRRPDLPDGVERVIMKGLEMRPDDRWQTADEMTTALKAAFKSR